MYVIDAGVRFAGGQDSEYSQALGRNSKIVAFQLGKHLLDAFLSFYGIPELHSQNLNADNVCLRIMVIIYASPCSLSIIYFVVDDRGCMGEMLDRMGAESRSGLELYGQSGIAGRKGERSRQSVLKTASLKRA
jgi:hypothetical protein